MDILIIDDEGNLRRMIRALLEEEGYAVREADSAEAGIVEVKREAPEVILLDLMLPGHVRSRSPPPDRGPGPRGPCGDDEREGHSGGCRSGHPSWGFSLHREASHSRGRTPHRSGSPGGQSGPGPLPCPPRGVGPGGEVGGPFSCHQPCSGVGSASGTHRCPGTHHRRRAAPERSWWQALSTASHPVEGALSSE